IRQSQPVFGSESFVGQTFEGVFGNSGIFFGTEDQSDRRVFIQICPVLPGVVQVQVHLAGVRMGELSDFQVDDDEAPQAPVEEEQVDAVPFIANAQTLLASDKCEIAAEFHEKILQSANECFFQIVFRVFILQSKEFQDIRIFN